MTLLELFAAALLVGGSGLVLLTVGEADAAFGPVRPAKEKPPIRSSAEPPLRRAA